MAYSVQWNEKITRPKPVEHGYVFSMVFGTIGEWLILVPFFVRESTVDSVGVHGGGTTRVAQTTASFFSER